MTSLEKFFARATQRHKNRVELADALLSGRLAGYVWYRLRFFLILQVVAIALHFVEYGIFRAIFSQQQLVTMVLLKDACVLLGGFFWGAVEPLREQMRTADKAAREKTLLPWLRIAAWLALGIAVLATAGAIAHSLYFYGYVSVYHVFALAAAVRLAADLFVSVYYAGIYALQRIYRPLWAALAVELLGFVVVLALWQRFGAYSFAIGFLLSGLLARAVSIYYARAAYRGQNVHLGVRQLFSLRDLPRIPLRQTWRPGLAGASLRVGSMLVVVMLTQYRRDRFSDAAALLYLIGPLVNMSSSWAQTFYFDFKRLDVALSHSLRERFVRFLREFAWSSGVICFGIATAVSVVWLPRESVLPVAIALAVFFVARAQLALEQVRLFATERYEQVIAGAVAIAAGITLVQYVTPPRHFNLTLGGFAALFVVVGAAQWWFGRRVKEGPRAAPESLYDWIETLAAIAGPVMIGSASVTRRRGLGDVATIMAELTRALGADACVVTLEARRIVWFYRGTVERRELVVAGAGLLTELRTLSATDGRDALGRAAASGLFGNVGAACSERELRDEFAERFPDGLVIDVARGEIPLAVEQLPSGSRKLLWRAASRFVHRLPPAGSGVGYDVTAFQHRGRLDLIFMLPHSLASDARVAWRRNVAAKNLATTLEASLRSAAVDQPPPSRSASSGA